MKKLPNFGSVVTFALVLAGLFASNFVWAGEGKLWTFEDSKNSQWSWKIEVDATLTKSRVVLVKEDGVELEIPSSSSEGFYGPIHVHVETKSKLKGVPTDIHLVGTDDGKGYRGWIIYGMLEKKPDSADIKDPKVTDIEAKPETRSSMKSGEGKIWSFPDPHNADWSWDVEIDADFKKSRLYLTRGGGTFFVSSSFNQYPDGIYVTLNPELEGAPLVFILTEKGKSHTASASYGYGASEMKDVIVTELATEIVSKKLKVNTWTFADYYNPEWKWELQEPAEYSAKGEPAGPAKLRLFKPGEKAVEIPLSQKFKRFESTHGVLVSIDMAGPSMFPRSDKAPIGFDLFTSLQDRRSIVFRYPDFDTKIVLDPQVEFGKPAQSATTRASAPAIATPPVPAPVPAVAPKSETLSIRRWLFQIEREGYSTILVGFSVFQPDDYRAALTEFVTRQFLNGGEHHLGMTSLTRFEVVRKVNPATQKEERAYKLTFNAVHSVLSFTPDKNLDLLQPATLFAFNDGTVVINNHIADFKIQTRTFGAQIENVELKDFMVFPWELSRVVLQQNSAGTISYKSFFGSQGLSVNLPEKNAPWSAYENWKEWEHSPKTDIRRWTFEIARGGYTPILVGFSIYQPDGDSVLLEYANKQTSVGKGGKDHNLGPRAVSKFQIVTAKNPATNTEERAFQIDFDPERAMFSGEFYSDLQAVLQPVSILAFQDGTVVLDNQVGEAVEQRTFSAKVQDLDVKSFEAFPWKVARQIMEPGTIHAVPFEDYFGPKDINIRVPKYPISWHDKRSWNEVRSAQSRSSSSSGSSFSPAPSSYSPPKTYSSAKDLQLSGSLKGKEEDVWKLLQQIDKPTIAEFLAVVGGVPKAGEKNPFEEYGRTFDLGNEIKVFVPDLVSRFEYAFPGATWYGLGRDIYLFSDTLDAFYTYLGQPGRVRRLHASQPSFDEKNIKEVVGFLKTNGFDFKNIGPDSTPQIFFDVTSYSHGARYSQSSQLMRAAYKEWKRLGRNPRDLLSKVNFISTGKGTFEMPYITSKLSVEKFFAEVGMKDHGPETILRVDNSNMLQYSDAWHELYKPFEKSKDGSVTSAPGAPSRTELKLKLLWEMWEIAKAVMNDDFVKRANESGKKLHVKFVRCENLLSKPGS